MAQKNMDVQDVIRQLRQLGLSNLADRAEQTLKLQVWVEQNLSNLPDGYYVYLPDRQMWYVRRIIEETIDLPIPPVENLTVSVKNKKIVARIPRRKPIVK